MSQFVQVTILIARHHLPLQNSLPTLTGRRSLKLTLDYGFSMLCDKDGFYLPELIMT